MIYLDYYLYLKRLYQVLDLSDNPDKTGNLKFRWPVAFFSNGKEPREEENELN